MGIIMRRLMALAFATLFSASLALPAMADSFSDAQKTDIETIVHKYLLEHPEILQDMALKLDEKNKQTEASQRNIMMKSKAAEIFHDAADAVVGNPKGDVTVVEFFDYNCSWCKKSIKEMQSLVETDKNVRIVMKEFPIFGEGSEYAARAALASVKQGKYWQFHQALFAAQSKVTVEVVNQIAAEQKLDIAKLHEDMKDPAIIANVQKTQLLAQALAITGTPGFIVDDQLSPGYLPLDGLQAMIAKVRANGGCKVC
jgi:protein-disulfide isomerase